VVSAQTRDCGAGASGTILAALCSVRRLLLLFAVAACGGGDERGQPDAGPDASGPSFPAGEPDVRITQRVGTDIYGFWTDDALPDPYHVVAESGPCVLREREPYGCGLQCDDGICIADSCYSYPVGLSAGRLSVSGGTHPVEIDPQEGAYSYFQDSAIFAAGDQIAISAAGDEVPAFEIETRAVAELEAPGIDDVVLVPGEDFRVSWTADDADSRVRLLLESDQHGQFSPTVIECDVVDGAGSITVPGDMIEAFWATPGQCGECAVQRLARYSRGQATAGERPVVIEETSAVNFYPYDRAPY